MLGLFGVGVALILGVAVGIGAITGALMRALMYLADWVPSTTADGQPSGSANPIVDEHIVGIFGLLLRHFGELGRRLYRSEVGGIVHRQAELLAALSGNQQLAPQGRHREIALGGVLPVCGPPNVHS